MFYSSTTFHSHCAKGAYPSALKKDCNKITRTRKGIILKQSVQKISQGSVSLSLNTSLNYGPKLLPLLLRCTALYTMQEYLHYKLLDRIR